MYFAFFAVATSRRVDQRTGGTPVPLKQKSRPFGGRLSFAFQGVLFLGRFRGGLSLPDGGLAFQVCLAATTFLNFVALLSHINLYIRGLFRLCTATMDSVCRRFNIYLLAALSLVLVTGCASGKKKKEKDPVTYLRVHPQAKDSTTFTKKITLFPNSPVVMTVDQSPLLTDNEVTSAQVVDALGGYALVIKFDKRGQWLLDEHSSLNLGRCLCIFVQYGQKSEKVRWLAAPVISRRISDGTLIFTPDATREDAELIAKGLTHKPGKEKPEKTDKQWMP